MSSAPVSRLSFASGLFTKKAAIIGALSAVGAVVWSGCGSDDNRYYCDGAGCYECDAYGCTAVTPPSKTPCTGSKSCPPGSVCTAAGCTTTCSAEVECPKGEVCKNGLCATPTTDPGLAKDCTTKADCGDGKACVAGKCEACGGSSGPCPCSTAAECSSGQECTAGKCTAPGNTCSFSSECGAGKVCADGQCLVSCETNPCAAGFTCDKGVCKVAPPVGCTNDQGCTAAAPKCLQGSCVKTCTTDPECGAGLFCDQGVCRFDTRPKPNCTDDSQCGGTTATPKVCLDGFCKYSCTSGNDAYCRTIDSRIGYCAKDLVCRTASEATAECLNSTQCTGGKTCIDNACK